MSTPVPLPALGESVTEGTVSRWLKHVGDRVEVDEPMVEVSTDKVDTEIPAPVAGVILEIKVAEDEVAAVGAVLAPIGEPGEAGGARPAARSRRGLRRRKPLRPKSSARRTRLAAPSARCNSAPAQQPSPRRRRAGPAAAEHGEEPRLLPLARVAVPRSSCHSSVSRSPKARSRGG